MKTQNRGILAPYSFENRLAISALGRRVRSHEKALLVKKRQLALRDILIDPQFETSCQTQLRA